MSEESTPYTGEVHTGHVRRLRFAAITAAGLVATGGMGSGHGPGWTIRQPRAVQHHLHPGKGFTLFVDREEMSDSDIGVSRLRITDATLTDMCMSASIKIPGVGDKKFQMLVAGPNTTATNLVIGAKDMSGSLTLVKPQIGVDAEQLSDQAVHGAFGLSSQSVTAINQTITPAPWRQTS